MRPDQRPLEGRVFTADEDIPAVDEPVVLPPPPTAPAADEAGAPPEDDRDIHVYVHLPPGADTSTIEAAAPPWWHPGAYWKRNAFLLAAVLTPWPGLGAPAAWWAHLLGQVIAEQSTAGAWTIAAAGTGLAWCWDRRFRRWNPEQQTQRPALLPRALLATTAAGAFLALPVFDTLVHILTGAR